MLTLFTTPKPFKGHNGVIQRNALKSWSMLRPTPQIILFGDELASAEVATELNLLHVAEVGTTQFGTPLISSMFSLAEKLTSNRLLCYANADIMLTSRFMEALCAVSSGMSQFLLTGRRTNLDLDEPWPFDQCDWEGALQRFADTEGKLFTYQGMDYFAFTRGAFPDIPPFTVGRVYWDNWMIYSALERGIPVVDGTHDVLAIHQNHDYSHLAGGSTDCVKGPEGLRNQELYGLEIYFGSADATHVLKQGRLKPALRPVRLWRLFLRSPLIRPVLASAKRVRRTLAEVTRPARRRLGLMS